MAIKTERLTIRPPSERDRARMVELWMTPSFMVFSGEGTMTERQANGRFDRMMERASQLSFAKQPIVDRDAEQIVGYTGVDLQHFEGQMRMEWGYRLDESVRGLGYATEASQALMASADANAIDVDFDMGDLGDLADSETLHAIIDPVNVASQNVIAKLGFGFWKESVMDGDAVYLYKRPLGA